MLLSNAGTRLRRRCQDVLDAGGVETALVVEHALVDGVLVHGEAIAACEGRLCDLPRKLESCGQVSTAVGSL